MLVTRSSPLLFPKIWAAGVFASFVLCFSCAPRAPEAEQEANTSAAQHSASKNDITSAQTLLDALLTKSGAPALSVSVWRDDEIVWSKAVGVADIEHNAPATPSSLFRIASISKALTASLTARLAEEGIVDLDADIRETLPHFPDKGAPISLRQLLGHLGGIRHYQAKDYDFDAPGGMIDTRPYLTDEAILALFVDDPLVAAPGEKFSYTTFGYTLIGAVLEAATGRDYFDLLSEYVLAPASANSTFIDEQFAIIPGRVGFYDPIGNYEEILPPELGPIVNAYPLNSAYKRPGGGLISTADDLVRIAALHFSPGYLSADMHAQVFTSQKNAAGEDTGTGLGWRIDKDEAGRIYYQHRGSQNGSRAFLILYPHERIAVALLSNLNSQPSDIITPSRQIAEIFMDQ